MSGPNLHLINIIDQLTQSEVNFALYRLPHSETCHLVLQQHAAAEKVAALTALNNQEGFVMAPFVQSTKNSILLIRPDITACGWQEMETVLDPLVHQTKKAGCNREQSPSERMDPTAERALYNRAFTQFFDSLTREEHQKLVLSRQQTRPLKPDFSPTTLFLNACESYGNMMIYLCHTTQAGTWIGSTPEIIIEQNQDVWHTVALAGTMDGNSQEWSAKNRKEQQYVADYIRDLLIPLSETGQVKEEGPYTVGAGALVHLKSDFFFKTNPGILVGDLVSKLHPTPAVCGLPQPSALTFIQLHEGYDRKYYSGIVGAIGCHTETHLYVNLRCMDLQGNAATLYAGGGLMPTSTLEQEWEETEKKLATLNRLLDAPDYSKKSKP